MTAELLVVVPSRERPENAWRLLETFRRTARGVADLLLVVDDDDPTRFDYPASGLGVELVIGPRGSLSELTNRHAVGSGRFAVGSIGDDHLPRSDGWAERILEALRDLGSGFAYGDDLFHGELLPTACFATADVVDGLGWFCLPTAAHLYVDRVWRELGRAAEAIRFLPDVVIEHVHPEAGKAASDPSYERSNSPERWERDRAAFRAWRRDSMAADVELVRSLRAGKV